jgi:2-iminobutanoate/2-iminopropanoate deaminase
MTTLNPSTVRAPAGLYSHAVETPANARWLHCAGQIGIAPDGSIPEDFAAQAEQAWRNIRAILAAADMAIENIVRVNHYLTRPSDLGTYREMMGPLLGDARPASTLLVVQALARPSFLIEVEVIAAK